MSNHLRLLVQEKNRPREKILQHGISSVTDEELLAVVLGTGTSEMNVLELASLVLEEHQHDLSLLSRMSVRQLIKIKGIGPAKAIQLTAAFEMARRKDEHLALKKPAIRSSNDAYSLIKHKVLDIAHEEFWVMLLNRANNLLASIKVSSGGLSGTVADPKVIFEKALSLKCSGIILVHNHPSGNLKPSQADIKITKQLREAGKFLDLPILDHIIVGANGYFSFADEQKL
ncbi:MAG: RadC family protein [Flavobacteriales bacterium]